MADKHEYDVEKTQTDKDANEDTLVMNEEVKNSRIEAVALVVPVTNDPSLNVITFRYWFIASFFSIIDAIIQQYYFYRTASSSFSIGKFMEKYLPVRSISLGRYSMSLNPGPFNIKEHALIRITVSTAAGSAYAIDTLSTIDLLLNYRIGVVDSLILIITTQCVGYDMAGLLRRYLVYLAEMCTGDFKTMRMIRSWSYMKYFWILCIGMFIYEFIPQLVAPLLVTFDSVCWLNPFNRNVWALFSSVSGGGIFLLSFDWTSIGNATLWLPLSAQLCTYGGMDLHYWVILPILWLNNVLGTKSVGRLLTSHLFYDDGTPFNVKEALNLDYTVNWDLYNAGKPTNTTLMYALGFITSFVALAGSPTPFVGLIVSLIGLNVITELVCGYMLPGKPIANMTFKCYGYMAMYQCQSLLSDLKLGHYIGILNGTKDDPTGHWTGQRVDTFWGSGLIYGALGPAKMFASDGKYWFYQWSKLNVTIIAGGMGAYPNGYAIGIFPSIVVCLIFQGYTFRYYKGWWKKYVFVLSAALDTGAAFTGLVMFLFFSGGVSPTLSINFPHWWSICG
ncbi:hypothetical protein BGZ47_005623 [Haplosporangium gracile]|nr:hypothetical protein BGZ47_005623 [Haplosporangium gracile]